MVSASLPANTLTAGMSFRVSAAGIGTTGLVPGTDTFRIRIGPTTLTGNIPTSVAPTAVASVTGQPFTFEAIVTIRTAGASGTVIGECIAQADNIATGLFTQLQALSTTASTVALDTTATNLVQLTFQSATAGSSCTFEVAFIEQGSATGALLNPMTTAADLIVGGTSGVPTRLAKGSDSQVLTVDPTTHLLVWATPSSGFTNPMTTKGDVITGDTGGTATRLGAGTSTYVLTSNGAAAFPSWQAPAAGGSTIQYPALKPGTPTDDFAGASLGGGYSAHSSGGTFITGDCMTQGVDWVGSSVELQFSAQFGGIYTTHSNTDLDFTWGGVTYHGQFQENAAAEAMYGIAALNSSGTGVGVVAYTADIGGYFATITTWQYATNSDSWLRGSGGSAVAQHSPVWFRLKRVSGTWTGYMSKSGRTWDKTFSTRADSITVDRLYFGMLYDNSKVYSGRLTADYYQLDV